jgi:hypothetical protein
MNLVPGMILWSIAWLLSAAEAGPSMVGCNAAVAVHGIRSSSDARPDLKSAGASHPGNPGLVDPVLTQGEEDDPSEGNALDLDLSPPAISVGREGPSAQIQQSRRVGHLSPRTRPIRC